MLHQPAGTHFKPSQVSKTVFSERILNNFKLTLLTSFTKRPIVDI